MYHIGQVNIPDQRMLQFSLDCLLNNYKELLLKQKKQTNKNKNKNKHKYQAHLKGDFFFPIVSRIFFWMSVKIKDELVDIIYVCQFVHVSLSSTQFSSDQIQNGKVNSDGGLLF